MIEDLFDTIGGASGRVVGLALLVGVGVVLGRGLRPAAKGAIRGYFSMADRVKEAAAEAGESLSDIYAEAKAEHEGQEGESVSVPTEVHKASHARAAHHVTNE